MTAINDAYINALLADAAYVNGLRNGTLEDQLTGRMTSDLAKYISDNFTVVNQVGGLASSFDATVWRGNAGMPYAGQIYVSLRGTQEGPDFAADGDLATSGLAHQQLADMVNWWLRETTSPLTHSTPQYATQITVTPSGDFTLAAPVLGSGNLADIGPIKSVNGHSLGGYLASSFARIFGGKWPIETINTFNSAGFSKPAATNIENGFNQIAGLMGGSLGLGGFSSTQNNYFAQNSINVTTNTWDPVGFTQYGLRTGLFQEDLTPELINNHYIYKLTDMLALGNALEKLDPSLNFATLFTLMSLGNQKMEASYEGILDTLRKLFLGNGLAPTQTGDANANNTGPQPESRRDFHTNLAALQNADAFKSLQGKVRLEIGTPALASAASTDFGALVSLLTLSPFALRGLDSSLEATLSAAWPQAHAQWQADHLFGGEGDDALRGLVDGLTLTKTIATNEEVYPCAA